MSAVQRQLIDDQLGFALLAPVVRTEPTEMQQTRRHLLRALADADEITHPRLRRAVQRSLFMVAAELGCAVCGKPITLDELETCALTRSSLVHLWGSCSDTLAASLGMTVDDVLSGKCWP